MVRFPVYVEWGISRFGVSHILPIGQVESDIKEVTTEIATENAAQIFFDGFGLSW